MAETVGLLGGGVIGGGWAARFALCGIDVRLYDPAADAERSVGEVLDYARRAYRRLTLAPLPAEGAVTLVDSPEEAVQGVEFVQESAPEREQIKRSLLAAASRAAGPEVVFAQLDVGPAPDATAGRHGPPGAAHRRPPVQPRLPAPAGRAVRRGADGARDARARGRVLPAGRDAAAAAAPRGRRVRRRPPARGALARGSVARRRRRRHGRGDRRRDPLRRRPALGVHGHVPDVPDRRRRGRHAPLHGAVRPRAAAARGRS